MSLADAPAIATDDLTKRFGSVSALSQLTLHVPTGAIYGFLGPNGAGKTTTIRLLLGFVKPTSGSCRLFGHDCWADGVAARRNLGYLVEAEALFPDMRGAALLDYTARLSGRSPVLREKLLDALELSGAALNRKLRSYSKGMKQKLALIAAMQHDPALLILDEPTDGLDPLMRRNFEEVLRDLHGHGRTIFMSSHDLAEVERVCERVAIVRDGRLVAESSIEDLKRSHQRTATVRFNGPAPTSFAEIPGVRVLAREGDRLRLAVGGDLGPFLRALAASGAIDLELPPPSLDDMFMGYYAPASSTTAPTTEAIPTGTRR
ncbi:MAG: ABC transporter ATP-binding protein [Thermomicrobiales bacterium]|nr:ABC transporter ATP-binding protein [Thermomicrobiales bacterium]